MKFKITSKEIIFQVCLHLLVFLFYSFDKRNPTFDLQHAAFFLNYAAGALLITYFALPRFYKNKNYAQFFFWVLLSIVSVILIEEAVLERIFFPGERDNNIQILYTVLDVLPILTMLAGFKFAWDALTKQQEVEELKSAVKESELQFLKSQINPHFLFNNLNNLYSYAIENSSKTPQIILEFSGILRYMLYECKDEFVPLTKEVKQLKNFINLNELQIEERGKVDFQCHGDFANVKIAPLILMVFIENAFKHSMASQSENIAITVSLSLSSEGQLAFTCTNSHQDQSNSDRLDKGIGLANVKKRLELIYPGAFDLDLTNESNQFKVQLALDLNKTV